MRLDSADLYRQRGESGPAEEAYRQALALWPTNSDALEGFCQLLIATGRYREARDQLLQALRENPQSRRLENLLGSLPKN